MMLGSLLNFLRDNGLIPIIGTLVVGALAYILGGRKKTNAETSLAEAEAKKIVTSEYIETMMFKQKELKEVREELQIQKAENKDLIKKYEAVLNELKDKDMKLNKALRKLTVLETFYKNQ